VAETKRTTSEREERYSVTRYERNRGARLVALLVIASLFNAGCGTIFPRYLGLRPDAPDVAASSDIKAECEHRHDTVLADKAACEQYLAHVRWARQLAEAYRSRATLNEWAIYTAGTIALAGLSVVGGLGLAAAASAATIGLVGVSTGFASGFFAFMDNSTRAGFYTVAANDLSTALAKATQTAGARPTAAQYDEATKALADSVSRTVNQLESHRSSEAAAAAASQQIQKAQHDLQELTKIIETASLADLHPSTAKAGDTVVVVVAGIDLTTYKDRVRIFVGGKQTAGEVTSKTEVKFKVAPVPATTKTDTVRVWVGPSPVPGERTLTYT
jgi:hypothetical protein